VVRVADLAASGSSSRASGSRLQPARLGSRLGGPARWDPGGSLATSCTMGSGGGSATSCVIVRIDDPRGCELDFLFVNKTLIQNLNKVNLHNFRSPNSLSAR
jgi:hypothetical protein